MYIRGLIPRNFAELAEAVPIVVFCCKYKSKLERIRLEHAYGLSTEGDIGVLSDENEKCHPDPERLRSMQVLV